MSAQRSQTVAPSPLIPMAVGLVGLLVASLAGAILVVLLTAGTPGTECGATATGEGGAAASIVLGPPGTGQRVGASEYGGPGDPSSGTVGAAGISLRVHPDSYAELGGSTFQSATAMGGLPYMTPLRVSWGVRSAVAYKRDFGLGGGPVAGLPRVIDLWWQLAEALRIPYEDGLWSGAVTVSRPPATGAGGVLGQAVAGSEPAGPPPPAPLVAPNPSGPASAPASGCAATVAGLPITGGPRAQLLAGGQAAAPAQAPAAVRGMIAAGNQIAGRPYVYGAAHGLPLNQIAPAYDCSSSVAHLLYGGAQLPITADPTSGALETYGLPGPGRWVTLYASAAHVFMYVAGLRWDTWNAAGPQDGGSGIGWHPLIRGDAGFVARHPVGL